MLVCRMNDGVHPRYLSSNTYKQTAHRLPKVCVMCATSCSRGLECVCESKRVEKSDQHALITSSYRVRYSVHVGTYRQA